MAEKAKKRTPLMTQKGDINLVSYIKLVLKKDSKDVHISANALYHLNSILNHVSRIIIKESEKIRKTTGRETLSFAHVKSAILLALPGELKKHSIAEAEKAKKAYENYEGKKARTSKKAGLIIPVSRVRSVIYSPRSSPTAAIAIAAALEYFLSVLLYETVKATHKMKKVTITSRHIYLAVQDDEEFAYFFAKQHIKIAGSGVLPNIWSVVAEKREGTRADRHRRLISRIKNSQKQSDCVNIPRAAFSRFVREVQQDFPVEHSFSKNAMIAIQMAVESQLVDMLSHANLIAIHAGRTRVSSKDISLSRAVRGERI